MRVFERLPNPVMHRKGRYDLRDFASLEVKVVNNDLEKAMKVLKKKIQNDGLFRRLKLKKSYIKKAHPKAEIKEAEKLMKADGTVTGYEVEVKTGKKKLELELDAAGKILKTERD